MDVQLEGPNIYTEKAYSSMALILVGGGGGGGGEHGLYPPISVYAYG